MKQILSFGGLFLIVFLYPISRNTLQSSIILKTSIYFSISSSLLTVFLICNPFFLKISNGSFVLTKDRISYAVSVRLYNVLMQSYTIYRLIRDLFSYQNTFITQYSIKQSSNVFSGIFFNFVQRYNFPLNPTETLDIKID